MQAQSGKFGDFVYFSLQDILAKMADEKYFPSHVISLCINVDGLPLYKSSSTGFWPILRKVFSRDWVWNPFPVAIYSRPGKPKNVEEYLGDLVIELTSLIDNGLEVRGQHYDVEVLCNV